MKPNRQFTAKTFVLMAIAAAALCGGCNSPSRTPGATQPSAPAIPGWPRTVTDAEGTVVKLSAPPKRIVSLAPSNTEILFAIGAGDRVAADTESCDYPPEAKQRPHVGGMSAGDLEKIEADFPDLVVAVGSLNGKLIAALRSAHVPTLVVDPHTTEDVIASIHILGQATGQELESKRIEDRLSNQLDRVRAATARATKRPKTLIVYSANPIYTTPPTSFIHDVIEVAGGDDIVKAPLVQNIISPAVVIERAPEVIICSPYLRERLKALPGWSVIPAVKNNRFFSDGDGELTRPGPRLGQAAERLARYLHPDLFSTGAADGTH